MRNFLLFIVVIGTLSFTISSKVSKSTENAKIAVGKLSPQFLFENNEGRLVGLNEFSGSYVFINIWASECDPCKEELQMIESLKKVYSKNIEFVSISLDHKKDTEKWKQYVANEKLTGTQLISDKSWHSSFIRAYNIKTIPRYILVSPTGMIVETHAPRPSQKKLIKLFKKLNIQ
jgi:thiol-disulfide isomerase/thioredoxin